MTMTKKAHRITDDTLSHLLEKTAGQPVIIEANDIQYRIEPEDPFAFYDPEKVLAAIDAGAGAFAGLDTTPPTEATQEARTHDRIIAIADRAAVQRLIHEAKPKAKSLEWGPETRYGREDDFNNGFNEAIDEYEAALLARIDADP
jgi:hypothetical protein